MNLPPNKVLEEMLLTGRMTGPDGQSQAIYSNISADYVAALYRTMLQVRPKQVIEIGMCCGISTLTMLTALQQLGEGGRLISIDPWQTSHEKGIGMLSVQRAGLESLHEVIEKPSHAALPELLDKSHRIDFAYVDGNHMFDYALLDFFYLDKMLNVGGVIGFNDCGWRSIHHVLRFVKTHRKYKELETGLPKQYKSRNPIFSLIRRLQGRSNMDRYFQKLEEWEPHGNFYRRI